MSGFEAFIVQNRNALFDQYAVTAELRAYALESPDSESVEPSLEWQWSQPMAVIHEGARHERLADGAAVERELTRFLVRTEDWPADEQSEGRAILYRLVWQDQLYEVVRREASPAGSCWSLVCRPFVLTEHAI